MRIFVNGDQTALVMNEGGSRKLLEDVNPNELTPKQAHELIYELMDEAMKRG